MIFHASTKAFLFFGVVAIYSLGCTTCLALAEGDSMERRLSLKETFTAVILANDPCSSQTTSSAAIEPSHASGASAASMAAEAGTLADNLVRSLAEVILNAQTDGAVGSTKVVAQAPGPEWALIWTELFGDPSVHMAGVGGQVESDMRLLRGDREENVSDERRLEEEGILDIENTWVNIGLTSVCVVCAGLAAGLTMGLVSIEPLEMAIKQRSGTPEEQRQASRILPLVNRHHFLLVTLLLFNSLANEALPIFLGNLVPDWLAVILSVSLVLFFGEILPSAIFTGRAQLAIAANMAWFVYALMFILSPLAWPLSWMLDRILGIEGLKRYKRAEIAALVEVQQELSQVADEEHGVLKMHADEVAIVNGVLQTAEKSVAEAMVPMDKVFCLSMDERLSANTMADIMAAGYSRILVYEGIDTRNIRGYLQVKKLIILNPDDKREIASLMLRIPVVVSPNKSLLELLNTFQTGRAHLALVSNSPGITLESLKHGVRLEGAARPVGIITLEDIIEEIIQEEIMDESDRLNRFIENRAKETLLRFARMRQNRQILGRYSTIGLSTPGSRKARTSSLLRDLSARQMGSEAADPPSTSHGREAVGGRNGDDGPFLFPSPRSVRPSPNVDERTSLVINASNSGANRYSGNELGGKRSNTIAEAMIAAAGRAKELRRSDSGGGEGVSWLRQDDPSPKDKGDSTVPFGYDDK